MSFGQPVEEASSISAEAFRDIVLPAGVPVVMRGLADCWKAVAAARCGEIAGYLKRLDRGVGCDMLVGPPSIGGRFFYSDSMRGFNFERRPSTISAVVDQLVAMQAAAAQGVAAPTIAVQAAEAAGALPGFAIENPAPLVLAGAAPRLWINNRLTVAAHHDASRNLAVVVAGRRRFTLFAPEEVGNLYLGPLEFSPAGTPISLVDFNQPDLERYPRFAAAMKRALVAELEPGDALYIPYMWWHHVESLDSFNLLANYWWNETPPALPGLTLVDVIVHARLAFSAATPQQRRAWRAMLTYAVGEDVLPAEVPADRGGIMGAIGEMARQSLRKQLAALLGKS
jgi:Cupin-like domain